VDLRVSIDARSNKQFPSHLSVRLRKVVTEASIAGLGCLVGPGLAYLSSVMTTRGVGASAFGAYSLAVSVVSLAEIIASLGLGTTVLRFVGLYKGQQDAVRAQGVVWFALKVGGGLGLCVSIGVFVFAPLIAETIFHTPNMTPALRVLSAYVPLSVAVGLLSNALQGFQVLRYRMLIQNLVRPLAKIGFIALFVFGMRMGLLGLAWSVVLSTVVAVTLAFYWYRRVLTASFGETVVRSIEERGMWLRFSIPLYLRDLLDVVWTWLSMWVLGYCAATLEVGWYSAAQKIALFVAFPLHAFNAIFGPIVAELYGRGATRSLEPLLKTVTRWIFTVSLPVFLVVVFCNSGLLAVFGREFAGAKETLLLVALGQLLNAATGPVGLLLIMTGRPGISLLNAALLCVFTLVLGMALIPGGGAVGAGATYAISLGLINMLRLVQVLYYLHIHPYDKYYVKPIAAAFPSILVALLVSQALIHLGSSSGGLRSMFVGIAILVSYLVSIRLLGLSDVDKATLDAILDVVRTSR